MWKNSTRFIVGVLAIFASCKNPTSPTATCTSSPYFPESPGSWWTYAGYQVDSTGARIAGSDFVVTDSLQTGPLDSATARKTFMINDPRHAATHFSNSSICDPEYQWDCTCGVWIPFATFSKMNVGNVSDYFAVGPPSPVVNDSGMITYIFRYFAQHEYYRGTLSVNVPRGTFPTELRTDSSFTTLSAGYTFQNGATMQFECYDRNFASGVGIVREMYTPGDNSGGPRRPSTIKELVAFEIK